MQSRTPEESFLVAAFYKFVALPDYKELRGPLTQRCEDLGLLGTILLAGEGINGTISGPEVGIRRLFERLAEDPRFADLTFKESWSDDQPFYRMKVRLKKEIVSMGVEGIDPASEVGEYVSPEDWNALIGRDDVRLIDARNDYEVHLGRFANAEDPDTRSFRDFPVWVDTNLDPERDEHVAMYCTGGIRCEKATSYLLQKGFKNVYHLDGGILNYLEQVDHSDTRWEGDCFVFDNRVTVDHDLAEGDFEVCPACRMPLTKEDQATPQFEKNVSCPRCFDRLTPEKREGLLERARQIELANQRGQRHIGMKQKPPAGSSSKPNE
ncbi:MAG TPA: rhodanese-related sulfurtransferase [Xanthomonadales bacterium]|nr:rhodanese-related sulfurtransferase [Xanthomonadales bacterium]